MASQSLYDAACEGIMKEADATKQLSQSIWENPELGFKEKHAHQVLCDFLEKRGFLVERSYTGIETAFKASWTNMEAGPAKGPHIVVVCEYDALPEMGHACGHNLIAQTGVAAGLGVKAAMETHGKPLGTITVLGTPAEEGGGGKVYLLNNGALDGVDAAMMVHPAPSNMLRPSTSALCTSKVTFTGRASHAAAAPWEGLNALDAAVMTYNSMAVLRQQMRPTTSINVIISKGGVKPNIIPELTEMEIYLRCPTGKELVLVNEKVSACIQGAAISTGCQAKTEQESHMYEDMMHNSPMLDRYYQNMKRVDKDWTYKDDPTINPSTDMGNVSKVVPSIHPCYKIGDAPNHSQGFTKLAGSPEAQAPTLDQGRAMAMTVLDLMSSPSLLDSVKEDFRKSKEQ